MGDDVAQAGATLGRPPDSPRDDLPPALLSALWRLHGRIAFAKGDQSRAIALLGRALRHAEQAHDSEAIGLAHYELGHLLQAGRRHRDRPRAHRESRAGAACRRKPAISGAAALVVGVVLAQSGRLEEAIAALRQAERLAASVQAKDVLGIICNNQANVALIQHRHDQALALAERSAALQEQNGPGRGLAISLADARPDSRQARQAASAPRRCCIRALEVRRPEPVQRDYRRRLRHAGADRADARRLRVAGEYLRQAGDAYGSYGGQTGLWYEWSIRVLEAKLAARRGATEEALRLANEIAAKAPAGRSHPGRAHRVRSAARGGRTREAETAARRRRHAHRRRAMPGAWGEFLRLRGALHGIGRAAVRGVPRHRAERERVRAHRRGISGRAEPSRARPAREPRRARARRPNISSRWPRRCSNRWAPRAILSKHRRPRRSMPSAEPTDPSSLHRCRRCRRSPPGRCGGVSRTARARNRGRRSRYARRRLRGRVRGAARRRRSGWSPGRAAMSIGAGHRAARGRPLARHRLGDLRADGPRRRRPTIRRDSLAAADGRSAAAPLADDRRHRRPGLRSVRGAPAARRAGRDRARATARAAAARVPVRQPGDDAGRRADSAPAGQRADGADHRRKRNR